MKERVLPIKLRSAGPRSSALAHDATLRRKIVVVFHATSPGYSERFSFGQLPDRYIEPDEKKKPRMKKEANKM